MTKSEEDLARVLKFMRDHDIKLSRRSQVFLLKQFPSLTGEINKTAEEQKQNSQRINKNHSSN